MKTFIQKLDCAAERWIHMLDNQLQDTTVRTVTGEVFHHDTAAHCAIQNETPEQDAPLAALPVRSLRGTHKTKSAYPPVLRKASASQE